MNGIWIWFIVIIVIIVAVVLYYKKTYNQIANVYPTKDCNYQDYYYLWLNMKDGDTTLADQAYNQWNTDVLLSGPNRIGIYVSDPVSNDVLAEYVDIYNKAFNFDPSYIRGSLSDENKNWCKRNGLQIKSGTSNLSYCN
tara:strand:- start:512 stop:928 length:417 start_codon:yes stop_codon:yes gene_type:complete